ncbi:glycosyltransferase [Thiomicrolovo sp. ZZH C-3]
MDGLSLIIVNYFCETYIEKLVDSVLSNVQLKNLEIVIVSNSIPAFQWTDEYQHEYNIKIINNHGNEGFGRAINKGVENSQYDYFCMVNPDMELVQGNILDELYGYFQTLPDDVGALSCLINNDDGTRQHTFFMQKGIAKMRFLKFMVRGLLPYRVKQLISKDRSGELEELIKKSEPFEVGGFHGPFVMMRRSAFFDVGGFDPDFFMYAEDIELFRNRFYKKYKSMVYPKVGLVHFSGKTDKYGLMSKQSIVSYMLYLKKQGNYFLGIYVFFRTIKSLLLLLFSLFKGKKYGREAFQFLSTLKYVKAIVLTPRGFHTRVTSLKIDEIPD